jgi:hypothetical protein
LASSLLKRAALPRVAIKAIANTTLRTLNIFLGRFLLFYKFLIELLINIGFIIKNVFYFQKLKILKIKLKKPSKEK